MLFELRMARRGAVVNVEAAAMRTLSLLLALGADPNTYGTSGGGSANADPNTYDRRTPLGRAGFNNRLSTMRILLEHGAHADPAWYSMQSPSKDALALLRSWDAGRTERAQAKRSAALVSTFRRQSTSWTPEARRAAELEGTRQLSLQARERLR